MKKTKIIVEEIYSSSDIEKQKQILNKLFIQLIRTDISSITAYE